MGELNDAVGVEEVAAHLCYCGRRFRKRFGLNVHGRTCPVEQARSAAYVLAIEAGTCDPHAAGLAAVREALAAGQ